MGERYRVNYEVTIKESGVLTFEDDEICVLEDQADEAICDELGLSFKEYEIVEKMFEKL